MSEANYTERAAEFNKKMGLSDPDSYWDDALIRFTVIGEEVGELLEAVNKDGNVGEELADVVITCYTGADTLDLKLPENFEVHPRHDGKEFEDETREVASEIFKFTSDVYRAISNQDRNALHAALVRVLGSCHRLAKLLDVNLAKEYKEKMDYNMKKSGSKVNGKPVDDVYEQDG